MKILPAARFAEIMNLTLLALLSGCVIPGMYESDASIGDNGSFEVVQSGLPVNWIVGRYAVRDGDAELSFDRSDAVDGSQSLKIVVHRVDNDAGREPWIVRTRAAEPGATYAVSFWLKSTACVLAIEIRNEGKDPPFGLSEAEKQDYARHPPIRKIIGGGETDTDRWRQFRYVYGIPETDGSLRFELRLRRPCTLWIDDVRIELQMSEPVAAAAPVAISSVRSSGLRS